MSLSAEQQSVFNASIDYLIRTPLDIMIDFKSIEMGMRKDVPPDDVGCIASRINDMGRGIMHSADALNDLTADMAYEDLTRTYDRCQVVRSYISTLQENIDMLIDDVSNDKYGYTLGFMHGELEQSKHSMSDILKECVKERLRKADDAQFFSALAHVAAYGILDKKDEPVFGKMIAARGHYVFIDSLPDGNIVGLPITDYEWDAMGDKNVASRWDFVAYTPDEFGFHTYISPLDLARKCEIKASMYGREAGYTKDADMSQKMSRMSARLSTLSQCITSVMPQEQDTTHQRSRNKPTH